MIHRTWLGLAASLLIFVGTGVAVGAEEPDNAEAFRAEQKRRVSPQNPHGYQPVPQDSPTILSPYDTDDGRSRRQERQVDERFGRDDRFGNDVPRRQR